MTLDCLNKIVKDRQSRVISLRRVAAYSYETLVWVVVAMRVETARFGAAVEAAAFFVFGGLAPGGNYETSVWVVVAMRVETARFGAAMGIAAFFYAQAAAWA